jgi:heat shock protein HtpX
LASALQKIAEYGRPMARQSKAIAHLYISDPKAASSLGKKIGGFFATHPPVEERVRALVGQ